MWGEGDGGNKGDQADQAGWSEQGDGGAFTGRGSTGEKRGEKGSEAPRYDLHGGPCSQ